MTRKFVNFEIFFQEYREFTDKLHNFSIREHELKEKLRLHSIDSSSLDPGPPATVNVATQVFGNEDFGKIPKNSVKVHKTFSFDFTKNLAEQDFRVPASPSVHSNHVMSELNGNHEHYNPHIHRPSFGTLESPPAHMISGDEFSSYPTGKQNHYVPEIFKM